MARKALGENYFSSSKYPINIYRVYIRDPKEQENRKLDYTEKKHSHDFSELVIVTEGNGVHWVEGMEHVILAGDVFLVQGNQQHYFKQRNNLVFYNLMFQPKHLALPAKELKRLPGYNAIFVVEPKYRKQHRFESRLKLDRTGLAQVEAIVKNMLRESREQPVGYEVSLLSDLLKLFLLLSRRYSENPQTSEGRSVLRIANIIGMLEEEYGRQWKLEDIARRAGMSAGNLNRIFKAATGLSPIDYLVRLRLQRSMELLTESALSITEIAFQTGFNDSNYFTRQFKRLVGIPPSTFRKQGSLYFS